MIEPPGRLPEGVRAPYFRRARAKRPGSRIFSAAAALAVAFAVAGCATTPPAPPRAPAVDPSLPLQLAGRFATTYITSLPETKRESASGRFELYKDVSRLTVDLISPLGQTIARAEHLTGSPATLQTMDNRRFTGPTLDHVFEKAIGIRVPAEKLPAWLSDRFEEVVERSADGRRIKARDAGWDIDRSDSRWDLVWQQGTERIEVRLLLDAD